MKQFTHIGDFDHGDDGAVPLPYREQPSETFDRALIHRGQLVTRTDRLPVRLARGSVANRIPIARVARPSRLRWMMQLAFGLSVVVVAIAVCC